jgi:hypothetical protein
VIQKRRDFFTTIRTEGGILPADLIQRIVAGDKGVGGSSPEDYHLVGERMNEAVNRSWNRLQVAWKRFRDETANLPDSDVGTTPTRERWLLPLFSELGYGRLQAARAIEIEDKSFPISHTWQKAPIHLVGCGVDLDKRTRRVAGAAQSSPHSLVQELLNRSDDYLWAFLSNGKRLRILRDNTALTRQAFVEFDLEAMMDGEAYAEFAVLFLLCHQSRVEGDKPELFWLEKWRELAEQQGTRALDALRRGVEEAITALGSGFLKYAPNRVLKARLQSGELSTREYLRQLRRIVYRLLFLFVAEDRDQLFAPDASEEARALYMDYYSTTRLRRLCELQKGTRHPDLYQMLALVATKLGSREGCPELGLPALGGFLFSAAATPDLTDCGMANRDLLEAVRALAFTQEGGIRRTVDYVNCRSQEFGSVYESLLELHPEMSVDAGTFELKTAAGNERKSRGSYYTPDSLVQCLLDSALDPVLEEAARKRDPERAILNLKVCDPACGSGHFLIGAAQRIARRLAAIRTGDSEPSPEATRNALHDVIGKCVFGVDKDPDAVEICRFQLWLEGHAPGKPWSFLDHHIKEGNSLLGATPALIQAEDDEGNPIGIPDAAFEQIEGDVKALCSEFKAKNKKERSGQLDLFGAPAWNQLGNLPAAAVQMESAPSKTVADEEKRQARYEEVVKATHDARLLYDLWCAAFVWKKVKSDALPYAPTNEYFYRAVKNPHALENWIWDEVARLQQQYQFFHWHLEFPSVFRLPEKDEEPTNPQTGWIGGFDVMLGNPPWERVKLQEKEWFATRNSTIASAANATIRRRLIGELAINDPSMLRAFQEDSRSAEGESHLLRQSGRFPLCGRGDVNTYAVFAENFRALSSKAGRSGIIIPSGIVFDDTTKLFFQAILRNDEIESVYSFWEIRRFFPSTDSRIPFCLLTLRGQDSSDKSSTRFAFSLRSVRDIHDEHKVFTLSHHDILLMNPNSQTCPVFSNNNDADICRRIYYRVPILIRDGVRSGNPWHISYSTMFHMSNDSAHFRTKADLENENAVLEWDRYILPSGTDGSDGKCSQQEYVPLYEAKMLSIYDHRASNVVVSKTAVARQGQSDELSSSEKSDPTCLPTPRYFVPKVEVEIRLKRHDRNGELEWDWKYNWLLCWRDITNNSGERTVITSLLPIVGVGHTAPIAFPNAYPYLVAGLVCNWSSFILDYVARQKVGGTHLTYGYLNQLPVLPPSAYMDAPDWDTSVPSLHHWILPRAIELIYTAYDMRPFAKECGFFNAPFAWNDERRFLLEAELNAAYFHLYGISRADVDYIMDTFSIVRRKDEEASNGDFSTKRTILEIFDEMHKAIETGIPYQTRLSPPPANGWIVPSTLTEFSSQRETPLEHSVTVTPLLSMDERLAETTVAEQQRRPPTAEIASPGLLEHIAILSTYLVMRSFDMERVNSLRQKGQSPVHRLTRPKEYHRVRLTKHLYIAQEIFKIGGDSPASTIEFSRYHKGPYSPLVEQAEGFAERNGWLIRGKRIEDDDERGAISYALGPRACYALTVCLG